MYKKSGIWSKLFGFVYSLEEHRPVDNEGQTSAHSTPDLGSLTEFHQLILLRLLRPDRFPSTARRYVTRHLTSVTSHPSSIGSILGSKERLLGVLVLLLSHVSLRYLKATGIVWRVSVGRYGPPFRKQMLLCPPTNQGHRRQWCALQRRWTTPARISRNVQKLDQKMHLTFT